MGKDLKGKELGKGITQRKDGRYQARFTNRFGKRQTIYGKTLKEIKNALHEETIKDLREENVKNIKLTVDEWFEIWSKTYKETTIKKTTFAKNKRNYQHQIKPVIGNKKVSEVTSFDIVSLTSNMAKKYTKGFIRDVHGILYDMFEQAYINELCKKNPVYGTKFGGKPNRKIQALNIEDQSEFLKSSKDNFYYNAFVVQLNTGLRLGEIIGLCVEDIDLKNNMLHVRHNMIMVRKDGDIPSYLEISTPKTNAGIRDIPINKACRKALINQLEMRSNVIFPHKFHQLVFFSKDNFLPISRSTYYRNINSVVKKINIKRAKNNQPLIKQFGSHTFRHTFATRCFEAGIPPKTVQVLLGHASIQMTLDIYTSVMQDKRVEDLKKIDTLMDTLCL